MEYADHCRRLAVVDAELGGELADLRGLGGVMAWMVRRGLPLGGVEIVQQDEFSLDFVIALSDGARHLVFGIT